MRGICSQCPSGPHTRPFQAGRPGRQKGLDLKAAASVFRPRALGHSPQPTHLQNGPMTPFGGHLPLTGDTAGHPPPPGLISPRSPSGPRGRSDLLPLPVLAAQLSDNQARGRLPPANGVAPEAGLGRCTLAHTGSGDTPLPAWGDTPRSPRVSPGTPQPSSAPSALSPAWARPRLLQRPPVSPSSCVSRPRVAPKQKCPLQQFHILMFSVLHLNSR